VFLKSSHQSSLFLRKRKGRDWEKGVLALRRLKGRRKGEMEEGGPGAANHFVVCRGGEKKEKKKRGAR